MYLIMLYIDIIFIYLLYFYYLDILIYTFGHFCAFVKNKLKRDRKVV